MAKLSNPQRVTKENVPEEYRNIVESVGSPYNDFSDQVYYALNGNLTVTDNLNMQYKDIELKVNNDGTPTLTTQYKSTLKTRTKGIQVIRVQNLTNPSTYPIGAPFVTFTENNQVITILHVTGLSTSNNYVITLLALGS